MEETRQYKFEQFRSLEVSYKNGDLKVKNAESLTDEFPPQIASAVVTI